MNSRVLMALVVLCACLGVSVLSSALTTMAIGDAAQAISTADDHSGPLDWANDEDLNAAVGAVLRALIWRIVVGGALIVAAAVLALKAAAQAAGLSMRGVMHPDFDVRRLGLLRSEK